MANEKFTKESSNIKSTEYNKETKELFVVFKNYRDPNKLSSYVYRNIPSDLWEALKKAESIGSFINQKVVKGGYPYEKLS